MTSVKCPSLYACAFRERLCKWQDDISVDPLYLIMFIKFARATCGKLFTFEELRQICADVFKEG